MSEKLLRTVIQEILNEAPLKKKKVQRAPVLMYHATSQDELDFIRDKSREWNTAPYKSPVRGAGLGSISTKYVNTPDGGADVLYKPLSNEGPAKAKASAARHWREFVKNLKKHAGWEPGKPLPGSAMASAPTASVSKMLATLSDGGGTIQGVESLKKYKVRARKSGLDVETAYETWFVPADRIRDGVGMSPAAFARWLIDHGARKSTPAKVKKHFSIYD